MSWLERQPPGPIDLLAGGPHLPQLELIFRLEATYGASPEDPHAAAAIGAAYLALANALRPAACENMDPGKLVQVGTYFERGLQLAPGNCSNDFIDACYAAAFVFHFGGQQARSMQWIEDALRRREALINAHPLGRSGLRFFQTRTGTLSHFGHLACEPEFYLKMKALGMIPAELNPVLLAPAANVANRALFEYWLPHLCVVTDPSLCEYLQPLAQHLEYDSFWVRPRGDKAFHLHHAMNIIQRRWEEEERPPLLRLTDEHRAHGRAKLAELGMPDDAWFVTVHVREQLESDKSRTADAFYAYMNSDIRSYVPAIEEVARRGGWVIRIGQKNMTPLPPMQNVIDLPHRVEHLDWLDIYCIGACRFFLASSSGANAVPSPFGVPSVWSNIAGMDFYPYSKHDIFLPKLLYSETENRHLSFRESLLPPFDSCVNKHVYANVGVRLEENEPEDIRGAVCEMLDRLEGKTTYSAEDEKRQSNFRSLCEELSASRVMSCRVGREYLKRNEHLL